MKWLMFLLLIPCIHAGIVEEAGCHSDYYFNERNVTKLPVGQSHASTTLINKDTVIAYISKYATIQTINRCKFSQNRLHVTVCKPADNSKCSKSIDLCEITTNYPLTVGNSGGTIYDIVAPRSTKNVYILTSGIGDLVVYTCNDIFTKCTLKVLKYPNSLYGITSTYSEKLYITGYDTYNNVYVITCNAASCVHKNVTSIATKGAPSPVSTVIKNKLHISIYYDNYIVINTCNIDGNNCKISQTLKGATRFGISYFNVATYKDMYYYVVYNNYYGPCTDLSIAKCDVLSDGSIGDCSKTQTEYFDCNYIIFNKPSIAFAPYLGAIVAISDITLSDKNIAVLIANIDLSAEGMKSYAYTMTGKNIYIGTLSLSDINEETGYMRMTLQADTKSTGDHDLYLFDIDFFPSIEEDTPFYLYSAGYSGLYSHGDCEGIIADEIITCTARLKAGKCVQKVIFNKGEFDKPVVQEQRCVSKVGRGVQQTHPRGINPHSRYACANKIQTYYYFDDGPSVPLIGTLISDIILYFTTKLSTNVYWRGGVVHDLCYHNTVQFTGYTKEECDKLALSTWIDDCRGDSIVDTIRDIFVEIVSGGDPRLFPIIRAAAISLGATCQGIAYIYYAFLGVDSATNAYFATNSQVIIPAIEDIGKTNNNSFSDGLINDAANIAFDIFMKTPGNKEKIDAFVASKGEMPLNTSAFDSAELDSSLNNLIQSKIDVLTPTPPLPPAPPLPPTPPPKPTRKPPPKKRRPPPKKRRPPPKKRRPPPKKRRPPPKKRRFTPKKRGLLFT